MCKLFASRLDCCRTNVKLPLTMETLKCFSMDVGCGGGAEGVRMGKWANLMAAFIQHHSFSPHTGIGLVMAHENDSTL